MLSGTLISVILAWVPALQLNLVRVRPVLLADATAMWPQPVGSTCTPYPTRQYLDNKWWSTLTIADSFKGPFESYCVQWEFRSGIPVRCLRWTRTFADVNVYHGVGPLRLVPNSWRDGITIEGSDAEMLSGKTMYMLPTSPLWLGVVFNAAFYGAGCYGLAIGITAARCYMRRRRGKCPSCGYELRASSSQVCPECGLPVQNP